MQEKSVLITGAAGFVGTKLCSTLSRQGWIIRSHALRLNEEPTKWQTAMKSADCVVHLAARVHQMSLGAQDEAAFNEVNVAGSGFVAEQAALAGVRRLVFLSSIKVNGEGRVRPYQSTDTPDPQDPYGRSKLAAEQVIREVCERNGMEWVIIRPPLVYGPGVRANFRRLIHLVELAMPMPFGSIDNRRSLVGLSNLADFIEVCMNHPAAARQVWLVADEECVSTPELLRRLSRLMNRRLWLFRFSPKLLGRLAALLHLRAEVDRLCKSLQVDASPARTQLGWRPMSSMDDELARAIATYRGQRRR